jgi:hypothetical protein
MLKVLGGFGGFGLSWVFMVFFSVGCWELGIPWCWVFLVGRFYGSLWVFRNFGEIQDWVTKICKYKHCNYYLGV